jgi:hypothetical protein
VTLVITDVSEKHIAFIVRVTGIGEKGTTSAVILPTMVMEVVRSSETLDPTSVARHHIQEDGVL